MSRRKKSLPADPVEITIESLSHEGRGIGHIDGKTVFVDGALSGETVMFRYRRGHPRYAEGSIENIVANTSPHRVKPECRHFSLCGGCSLQHLDADSQIKYKENVLIDQLLHIGGVRADTILPALSGPLWGYRNKARLGVKHVRKKARVLVGFREKYSSYVADIQSCRVLHPAVGQILDKLADLITGLSVYKRIAQIEVAVGEHATALIFRNLADLSGEDMRALEVFGRQHHLRLYLQPGGPDSVTSLSAKAENDLSYRLDEGDITIRFGPSDFTQVNVAINQLMVRRVIALLDISTADSVLDLYCGLGNFTLPIARRAAHVYGIESVQALVNRARQNAALNKIANATFFPANLTHPLPAAIAAGRYNKVLLDPPRSGAQAAIAYLELKDVSRLVYVSCNPATLARDAGILVKEKGYTLHAAGVMDMFPHTSHVESLAVFIRK